MIHTNAVKRMASLVLTGVVWVFDFIKNSWFWFFGQISESPNSWCWQIFKNIKEPAVFTKELAMN
jgi:hypothetical protein